jgi:hypothetical protein
VFASDGTGGLIVKGFVPKSTAAQCGRILEGDLLVQVRAACSFALLSPDCLALVFGHL